MATITLHASDGEAYTLAKTTSLHVSLCCGATAAGGDISLLTPDEGTLLATQAITFTFTKNDGNDEVYVLVDMGNQSQPQIAYSNGTFSPRFSSESTATVAGAAIAFVLKPAGGWSQNPDITVIAGEEGVKV